MQHSTVCNYIYIHTHTQVHVSLLTQFISQGLIVLGFYFYVRLQFPKYFTLLFKTPLCQSSEDFQWFISAEE